MNYAMKTYLINILGDGVGVGELWDVYQLFFNRQPFLKVLINIIAGILILLGVIFTIIGASNWKKSHSHPFLITGVVFIVLAILIIFFHSIYPHIKLHYSKKHA
jgi:hypothetical protein